MIEDDISLWSISSEKREDISLMEKIPLHESRDLLESSSDMGYFTRPRMVESGSFAIALPRDRERLLEVRDIITMTLHPCRRALYTEK